MMWLERSVYNCKAQQFLRNAVLLPTLWHVDLCGYDQLLLFWLYQSLPNTRSNLSRILPYLTGLFRYQELTLLITSWKQGCQEIDQLFFAHSCSLEYQLQYFKLWIKSSFCFLICVLFTGESISLWSTKFLWSSRSSPEVQDETCNLRFSDAN